MFRELRNGLRFFGFAMAGMLFGGFLGAGIDGHGPQPYPDEMIWWGAAFGTIIGCIAWMAFKSSVAEPPT